MKKINSILLVTFQVLAFSACGEKEPSKIRLYSSNIMEYVNLDVKYENHKIEITSSFVSPNYTFDPYTGMEIYLSANTIFDYDDIRVFGFNVDISFNSDGSCTYDCDDYLGNFNAVVFKGEHISEVCGYVNLNGGKSNDIGSINYITNDQQQKLYTKLIDEMPKPGEDTYSTEGCLYKFLPGQSGLCLYSVGVGDIISASISKRHNNARVTELGEGDPLKFTHSLDGLPHNYNDSITSLKLSKYTERINRSALTFATNLKKLELPDTMKYIGKEAFWCADLSDGINLPQGLETIEDFAFYGTKLKTIYIPNTVKYIGKFAFQDCDNLQKIYVEEGANISNWNYKWNVSKETSLGNKYYEIEYY